MDVGQSQLTEPRISGVLVSLLFFLFYCLVGLSKLPCGKFPRASFNKLVSEPGLVLGSFGNDDNNKDCCREI